jgi:hypothetical protein
VESSDRSRSPDSGDLLAMWAHWYPRTPPVGFLLREAHVDRWLRIYSLPEGKRLPTSGFDYAEIQRRHSLVIAEMLGDDPCLVLLLHTCKGRGSRHVGVDAGFPEPGLPRIGRLPEELWDETTGVFGAPMCVYGTIATRISGAFDRFIAATAEDRVAGVILGLATGRVYAPYDGGADLLYESSAARESGRRRFAAWASPREDGL